MKTALGVSLAAAVLAAGVGWASAGSEPAGRQGVNRGQKMSEYLGLSEDQKATWATLREEHKAEMAPLREEGRGLHTSLRGAMDAANPDPAAVGAATLAMKQHRDKVKAAEDAFQARLAGTLSADQRTKFEAFKAAHQSGRGHGFRGHRGHGPAGPDASSSGPQPPVEG